MSLPKIEWPLFEIEIPSTQKKAKFRQILVKEEKILAIAKQSGELSDVLLAVKQIVNNCCQEPNFDIDQLALFDLEYLFVRLFALSFTNVIKASYQDNEDDKIRDFEIDLDKIEAPSVKGINNNIKIGKTKYGMILRFPAVSLYNDPKFLNKETSIDDLLDHVAAKCVQKVYGDAEVYESTEEELKQFLDNLDIKTLEKVREFFGSVPSMKYTIEYENDKKNKRKIVLSTLNDFFSWF